MGTASRNRFASPIYVSALVGLKPIITTLNAVPPNDLKDFLTPSIQDDFKSLLL